MESDKRLIYHRTLAIQRASCVHMFVWLNTRISLNSRCAGVDLRYSIRCFDFPKVYTMSRIIKVLIQNLVYIFIRNLVYTLGKSKQLILYVLGCTRQTRRDAMLFCRSHSKQICFSRLMICMEVRIFRAVGILCNSVEI